MKILFLTQRDPFFTDTFFREFDKFNIEYSIIDLPNFNTGKLSGALKALRLYGYLGFLKLIVMWIIKYRKTKLKNLKICKSINLTDLKTEVQNFTDHEIVCSISAPSKIDINIFSEDKTLVNIHCGKLPRYAGMMPIFWQLYNDERHIIITLHQMAKEIDTGRVVSMESFTPCASLFDTSVQAKKKSARLLFESLNNLTDGYHHKNQDPEKPVKLNKFPNKQHIKALKKKIKLVQ